MSIIKTEVKVFKVEKQCEKCNIGTLELTGNSYTVGKTHIEHKCTNCEDRIFLIHEKYPTIIYEKVKPKHHNGPL
jgi:hypothetical protein